MGRAAGAAACLAGLGWAISCVVKVYRRDLPPSHACTLVGELKKAGVSVSVGRAGWLDSAFLWGPVGEG